jgi:hypothetical protein
MYLLILKKFEQNPKMTYIYNWREYFIMCHSFVNIPHECKKIGGLRAIGYMFLCGFTGIENVFTVS